MKRVLVIAARVLLSLIALILLGAAALVIRWRVSREEPAAFLPDRYVAYFQVPSIRGIYDEWLNLEAADVVLSRPELAAYHKIVTDARGLALTRSPIVRSLLDRHADIMLLKERKLLAVVDLGWWGALTPLARYIGPQLHLKGFSFLNDAGIPMYRYTTGDTTIHGCLANNLAIISLDPAVVRQALERRATDAGMAARASRELLKRMRLRNDRAVRVLADTPGITAELFGGSGIGARVLSAVELPGQSMLDVQMDGTSLNLDAELPVTVSMPELAHALRTPPPPLGVLRYVPSSCTLLSVSGIAPLGDLYRLAAAFQGKDVQEIYRQADDGAKAAVGAGIEELLFSWAGAETGAFLLPPSSDAVFFARIADHPAYERALQKITHSLVAGKDSTLVLDGVRVDRLALPGYLKLILDTVGITVPEPYLLTRGDYLFLSLDAGNLAAVARTADTGDNLARGSLFARLARGIPADPSLMVWYDVEKTEPFFLRGAGLLTDLLRLYGRGIAAVRITDGSMRLSLSAAVGTRAGMRLLPGFPLSPPGGAGGGVLAVRFPGARAPLLAWVRDRSTLVLAEAGGSQVAEAKLEPDSTILAEPAEGGAARALWAVSPGGMVWRFGEHLAVQEPFPIATGVTGSMPPAFADGRLALFSRADSTLVFVGPDGSRTQSDQKLDAPLFSSPDSRGGFMSFYPKSFDSRVHLTDLSGREAPGWPQQAAGISFCSPRLVQSGTTLFVTFMTQAGSLHLWTPAGIPVAPFPISLPGVFYATPQELRVDGGTALAALAQDGSLLLVGLDGIVLRQAIVPDLDGRSARICILDVDGNGRDEILLYGSGAFIAGYDAELRPLPGFPIKGVSRPQAADIDSNGTTDIVTTGMDGRIYAYTHGKAIP
jgi:hypothetical protein